MIFLTGLLVMPAWADMPKTGAFHFGLIGDQEYDAAGEAAFPALLAALDREDLAFVIHDGDIKPGSSPCTDGLFQKRLAEFNASRHPFIYTPGDNEWTDCWQTGWDPAERLGALRRIFFSRARSLGRQAMPLTSQGRRCPENFRWTLGPAVFATVNVTGSHNNFGKKAADRVEYKARNRANLAWIRETFTLARQGGFKGVLLAMQADPAFEAAPGSPARRGFDDTLACLEKETTAFGGPVVLVHGDSHVYRMDQPMTGADGRLVPNFTRVETFGPQDPAHWVEGSVDPSSPSLFKFMVREVPHP
jgi:hypothetical protein